MKHFTVDLEEWWSGESFKKYFGKKPIPKNDRINIGLNYFLELLKKYDQKATFFVLGRVAENHPYLIPKLVDEGHSIGTHGYNHELVYNQNQEEFELDLVMSLEIISKQAGTDVIAYRAPSYSITSNALWSLDILRSNGIIIDSSISPASNSRFGILGAPEQVYSIETSHGFIKEFPPNVIKLGKNVPITSGFGFRFFPLWVVNRCVKKFEKEDVNSMFIFHNWEMDEEQPFLKAGKGPELIHYYGISKMKVKVEKLLKVHKFKPLSPSLEGLCEYTRTNGRLEKKV